MNARTQKLSAPTKPALPSTLLVAMLMASVPTFTYAADDKEAAEKTAAQNELEEIIITGTRTGKALNKIPGAVSIINEMEIQHDLNLTADVTAMLARTVPGYGESKQQMDRRGETLRGRLALRLLDGVPQGSPLRDGSRDSIFTEMGIIQRIEVINGPSATEGIGATGGIINYITKTPTKMGYEFQISSQLRSQFEHDSGSWRVAANAAYKNENFDVLIAGSTSETGIAYDGAGETIGLGTSGSDRDSQSQNTFIKVGVNFGANGSQRLEVSRSDFRIECQCNWRLFIVNNAFGFQFNNKINYTSVEEPPEAGKASFNDFEQTTVSYTHNDLFGGVLHIQAYDSDQAMRFQAERTFSKQEPRFVPFVFDDNGFPIDSTPLVEQSEIDANKQGLRSAWSTEALLGHQGLGLQIGGDLVEDIAQQRLAIQDSVWVPPMKYTSFAPFAQVSLDIDAWTFTAGLRHEDGKLAVDAYVTSWANDRRPVGAGVINYGNWLPNFGAIWRVNDQWSVYASYSKGFTLPNAGIPLRNIRCSNDTSERGDPNDPINKPFGGIQPDGCPNDPAISVNDIIDLQAIIVDNKEIGFSWQGINGKFGVSVYKSTSDFGASLRVDPEVGDFVLSRKPTNIKGVELTGSYNLTPDFQLSAIYSHITGKTSNKNPDVLDRTLGVFNINPDKLIVNADWNFSDRGNVVVGSSTLFDRHINEGRAGEERINGYTLFNLTAKYEILGYGVVSVGVDNLLDKTYLLATSQVLFYKNYLRGRGREYTLGYNITF